MTVNNDRNIWYANKYSCGADPTLLSIGQCTCIFSSLISIWPQFSSLVFHPFPYPITFPTPVKFFCFSCNSAVTVRSKSDEMKGSAVGHGSGRHQPRLWGR